MQVLLKVEPARGQRRGGGDDALTDVKITNQSEPSKPVPELKILGLLLWLS